MRVYLTPAITCDWCETAFDSGAEPDNDDEFDVDEALQRNGWLFCVREEQEMDFCSLDCLTAKLS